MKIKISFFFLLVLSSMLNLQAKDQFEDIMNTVRNRNESGVSSTSIQTKVTSYLSSFNSETGEFNDINYTSTALTNWEPIKHLERIETLALAYTKAGNSYYQSSDLYNNIIKALELWNKYHPTSSNWWNIKIAAPKSLGTLLIQMRYGLNKIPIDLENRLMEQMESDYAIGPNKLETEEGANLTDLATGFFYRACLRKDQAALNTALEYAFEPLEIVSIDQEGIQHDNSFLQHGSQLYIGGYSEELIKGIINFALNTADTDYKLQGEKLTILSSFIRNTYLKTIRGQYMHYNVMGRSVSRNGATLKQGFAAYISHMATIDPANAAEYNLAIKRLRGIESPSSGIKSQNILYPIADYTLHVRPEYTFSVRSVSDRTAYIERGNGENLKAYFMTFGSTALTCTGDEYHNIFPVWDWSRIPGTTNIQVNTIPERAQWGVKGISKFVGGVSDSLYAVSTYMHTDVTNGSTTSANKSWFFFDDEIVCLGSGISTDYTEGVVTSVEQALKKGDITAYSNNKEETLSKGLHQYKNNISWIHHNNIGYYFPKGGDIRIENLSKTANWNEINTTQTAEEITKDVFSVIFHHGDTPQNDNYAYIIVPNKKTTKEAADYPISNIEILENNANIQVVYHKGLDILQMVFFEAGTFANSQLSITVDKPCAIILKDCKKEKVIMHIADPAHTKSIIKVRSTIPNISENIIETVCNFSGLSNELAGYSKKYIIQKEKAVLYKRESGITGDTYIQNGTVNENKNFGDASEILIKMDNIGYNREGFLKMSIKDMANLVNPEKEEVGKVELSLVTTYTNTGANQVSWILNPVDDTEWDEMQVTAKNKPTHQDVIVASLPGRVRGSGVDDRIYFDISEYAKEQYAKGKTDISFRLYNNMKSLDNKHDTKLGTKENITSKQPIIITTIVEKAPTSEYIINIPSIEGAKFDWPVGDMKVKEGSKFSFSLTLYPDYSLSTPKVLINGIELQHASTEAEGLIYHYEIENVDKDICIEVEGLSKHKYTLSSLYINGEKHDINQKYTVPCNQNIRELNIEVDVEDGVYLSIDKSFKLNVNTPSLQEVKFKIGSSAEDIKNEYILVIQKMFDFEDIIIKKFDCRLIINNNKATNGGFSFKKIYWIIDGVETEGSQIYSPNSDLLPETSVYSARLISTDNKELQVCPQVLANKKNETVKVYPNTVNASQVINIKADSENVSASRNTKVEIYSISGLLIKSLILNKEHTQITAPDNKGMYIIYIYNSKIKREFKLLVN